MTDLQEGLLIFNAAYYFLSTQLLSMLVKKSNNKKVSWNMAKEQRITGEGKQTSSC